MPRVIVDSIAIGSCGQPRVTAYHVEADPVRIRPRHPAIYSGASAKRRLATPPRLTQYQRNRRALGIGLCLAGFAAVIAAAICLGL